MALRNQPIVLIEQLKITSTKNREIVDVVKCIEKLQLENLDNNWVDETFQSEFLDISELPTNYESSIDTSDTYKALRSAGRALDGWKCNKSWTELSTEIPYRSLLALIYHLIDYGNRNTFTQEYRNNAVLAAQLYCKLLAVPGYKAYNVYHSQLLVACLVCLGFSKTLCDSEENRLSARERAREVNSYNTKLCSFLKDLKVVVNLLELQPEQVAFEELLNHLIDLTAMAINDKLNLDRLELNIISQLSYDIIHILLVGNDDKPRSNCIQALFKCLLPKLISTSLDVRASASVARASHVTYCAIILARYGKAALFGYSILLQHLSFSLEGMERAEVRASRVSLVVGLMSLLPKKPFKQFVDWILELSTTAKAPHRVLALEIFAKLLNDNKDDDKPADSPIKNNSEAKSIEPQPLETSTSQDKSTIQSDSEAVNSETLNGKINTSEPPAGEEQTLHTQSSEQEASTSSQGQYLDVPFNITTESVIEDTIEKSSSLELHQDDSQSSQESLPQQEEDATPVITAQTHSVPYVKILQATYERANDVSSTVRVRALAILMSCITSDQPALCRAVRKLNGENEQPQLISLAVRYMGDERAIVRKSAITLVDVQLRKDQTLLTKNNLGVLVSLCRDTSVLVRSTAVATLGELMLHWPQDCTFDSFLAGPMRQLKDPEPKVQEQIQEIVKEVLLSRLVPYSEPCEPRHQLAWQFLDAIARHNMRRHLEKVCGLLVKSAKCINHRLIDTISTHLGADEDNDLNCIVLLSSVARHVDYSDVDFLLSYYYQFTNNMQDRDARILPLVLEVLTDWSRWFTPEQRVALRSHLIDALHTGNCGSEGSRRSCVMLAAHLDPNDLSWASEFLLACERRALQGAGVSEWVCAADMSLVAPEQPSAHLVQLMLSTAQHFANPYTELPEWAQGSVVGALGRMCVRSRAIAALASATFARLLGSHTAPTCVRVNSLLALSDMCKRYSGIVEPLLGDMCQCLEDSPLPLRRAAVRALTRLALDDLLRLRAPLYYRYCALLSDPDPECREPVEYYVTSVLTSEVIYHNFVDSVMYYNGCSGHAHSSRDNDSFDRSQEASLSQESSVCVDLPNTQSGNLKMDSRQLIYDIMLQRMTPGQRLNVQCRLASEVLVRAAVLSDEEEALPSHLRAAVLDTVAVLRGPHMRLPKKPQTDTAVNVEDLTARVTSNILSHKMKKTVAEVLVPAVIRLYAGLSAASVSRRTGAGGLAVTPATEEPRTSDDELATSLVSLASDLLNEYRQEVEELLDNDPELVAQMERLPQRARAEPGFRARHNIVLRDEQPIQATPLMKQAARSRRAPLARTAQPPTKRSLRL